MAAESVPNNGQGSTQMRSIAADTELTQHPRTYAEALKQKARTQLIHEIILDPVDIRQERAKNHLLFLNLTLVVPEGGSHQSRDGNREMYTVVSLWLEASKSCIIQNILQ